MKLIRTTKMKIDCSFQELSATFLAFTNAFNFVCRVGYDKKLYDGVKLHHLVYSTTRETLPSQLAISARMKATEALKSVKGKRKKNKKRKDPTDPKFIPVKCPQSKCTSIRYDARSYTYYPKTQEVSISTLDGRKRFKLHIPEYYREFFEGWKNTSADLCYNKRTKEIYLNISFEKHIEDTKPNGRLIGIDRGINNLAVSSLNQFFGGGKVKAVSNRYQQLRSKLQSKNTKSAKRHLRKLSGKERRFRVDINHCIAKEIVDSLQPGDTIVLENLSGIRNKRLKKKQRAAINGWNFFQLEQFIIYKAAAKGISVVFIDPRYTSQRCSSCSHIERSNRNGSQFCCKQCSFKLNADLNAARNICIKYLEATSVSDRAVVNQPIVATEKLATSSRFSVVGN